MKTERPRCCLVFFGQHGRGAAVLPRTSQHERDIIGLLFVADPVIHRRGHDLTDLGQRQVPVFSNQIDQALLSELGMAPM